MENGRLQFAQNQAGPATKAQGGLKQTLDMSLKDSRSLDLALVGGSAAARPKEARQGASGEGTALVTLTGGNIFLVQGAEKISIKPDKAWGNR